MIKTIVNPNNQYQVFTVFSSKVPGTNKNQVAITFQNKKTLEGKIVREGVIFGEAKVFESEDGFTVGGENGYILFKVSWG